MQKKNNATTAVVVGHDHQNTLGVIRSLGESGIRVKAVLLADDVNCSTAQSKYIDEAIVVEESTLIDTLIRLGNQMAEPVPLIPCGDAAAAPVARAYERLVNAYILPCAKDGSNMLRLMNKINMLQAAQNAGLTVPAWVSIQQEDFWDLERLCADLRFPCILKPIDLLPGGTFEFRIIRSKEDLGSSVEYITANCSSIIIQQYIQKIGEFGVNACRLHRSGETVFCGVIEKKRFSQASLGSTTAGTICPNHHDLCEQARKFVEAIDYRGIFDMEFITDGEEYYFVEMNFRNGGYGYACTKAGRNLPAIWASEAVGNTIEKFCAKPIKTIFFINESADMQNVRAGNTSVFTWLWDVLRAGAHMYINCADMRPVLEKMMR